MGDPWEDEGFGAEDDWQAPESLEADIEDEDEELELDELDEEHEGKLEDEDEPDLEL